MKSRHLLALLILLPAFALAACGDESTAPVSPEASATSSDTTSSGTTVADDSATVADGVQELNLVERYLGPATTRTGWILGRDGEPIRIRYEVRDGQAIFEGDIVLGPQEAVARSREEALAVGGGPQLGVAIDGSSNHWPNGVVPYEIAADLPNQARVTNAIPMVEALTAGIDLVPRSGESDYVEFVVGSGCSSAIGYKTGRQTINLAGGCTTGNTAHEILHALGQFHEQSRCDRDDFVTINFDEIESGKEGNFDKVCDGATDYAAYNAGSIMHYPPGAFNKGSEPTIEAKAGSGVDESVMGQRDSVTTTDAKAMCALYCDENDPPTADLAGIPGGSVPEGSTVDFDAGGSTDPDDEFDYFSFAWTFGDGTCAGGSPPSKCSDDAPSHVYADDGSYPVNLTVRDGPFGMDITTGMNMGGVSQGFLEDDASGVVNVHNVAPSVDIGPDETIDEGDTYTEFGTFTDPGADIWTATVDYDDGAGAQALGLSGKSFDLTRTYPDDGVHDVEVTVDDDDGGSGSDQVKVTVLNVAPVVSAGPDATIDEGDTFSQSGGFTDPGADTWTATVDYDDGDGEEPLALSGKTFDLSHTYADDALATVLVSVEDDDGGKDTDPVLVTVLNVAPTVDAGPDATVTSGEAFDFSGTFSDPGVEDDPWSWTIDWGDGSPATMGSTGDQAAPILASHQVCAAGDYAVGLSVTDKDGGTGSDGLTLTVPYLGVGVDVRPGGSVNPVNLKSRGLLTVAVLSGPGFDATAVDPATVHLGDGVGMDVPVAQRRNGAFFATTHDANGDGLQDMDLKFETEQLVNRGELDELSTELVLRGFLADACTNFRGTDAVTIRGNRGGGPGS